MSGKFIKSQQYRVGRKMRSGYHFQDPMPRTKKDAVQDKKIENVQKSIQKINSKMELKWFDLLSSVSVSTTASLFSLCHPQQGTGAALLRVGQQIRPTSLQFRGRFTVDSAATFTPIVRMIVFWDKQPNAALPTSALLLDATVITPLVSAPYNHANSDRFKILFDRRWTVEGQPALTSLNSRLIKGNIKLGRQMKFNTTNGGTIADITSNSLICLLVSNDATNTPLVATGFRTYYKDN